MARSTRHIGMVRLIALVAAGTYLSACTIWRPMPIEPAARPAFDSTKTYRVLLANGDRRVMERPRILNDSVVSLVPIPEAPYAPPKRTAVALADLRGLEAGSANPAAVGVVLLVAVFGLAAAFSLGSIPWK
jgi:hypothetical protein